MFTRLFRHLWYSARDDNEYYDECVEDRRVEEGYAPVEALEPVGLNPSFLHGTQLMRSQEECRVVIYCMLNPMPGRRLTATQFLKSAWGHSIGMCEAGLRP
jgi:protein-serine/threonine kinase